MKDYFKYSLLLVAFGLCSCDFPRKLIYKSDSRQSLELTDKFFQQWYKESRPILPSKYSELSNLVKTTYDIFEQHMTGELNSYADSCSKYKSLEYLITQNNIRITVVRTSDSESFSNYDFLYDKNIIKDTVIKDFRPRNLYGKLKQVYLDEKYRTILSDFFKSSDLHIGFSVDGYGYNLSTGKTVIGKHHSGGLHYVLKSCDRIVFNKELNQAAILTSTVYTNGGLIVEYSEENKRWMFKERLMESIE